MIRGTIPVTVEGECDICGFKETRVLELSGIPGNSMFGGDYVKLYFDDWDTEKWYDQGITGYTKTVDRCPDCRSKALERKEAGADSPSPEASVRIGDFVVAPLPPPKGNYTHTFDALLDNPLFADELSDRQRDDKK